MAYKKELPLLLLLLCSILCRSEELVFQDKDGIVRWKTDNSEVALFGANYCLPSACDFRAAEMVNGDKKKMIEEDLTHFVRMGWDGLRLSFWGDWECCDKEGNLLKNEHLDLLDYLISEASKRNIMMLFSPIVTYNANWPDKNNVNDLPGFSAHYRKDELITNPKAIKAQKNYITQLLNHVNPYTGRMLKAEPAILFIEIINEPTQLVKLPQQTKYYINTMCEAIRKTGCKKLLYYNISQDFGIAPIVSGTKVNGGTYAWYPTQLNIGYNLQGNFLPYVRDYSLIRDVDIGKRSRLVYEFDAPDLTQSYMYPAMVREYRKGGVQFAAMFSYDMLETASRNLGWQTHNLNLVYTPQKAASAVIAAKAMKMLPLGSNFGQYPANSSFGEFRVDFEKNLSVLQSKDFLFYSNDFVEEADINVSSLKQIIGVGSSTVVKTDGNGIYFLDKIKDGLWRMEVYPNIARLNDPFNMPSPTKKCYQALWDDIRFSIDLPDLGKEFNVNALKNNFAFKATNGNFVVKPDLYILSKGVYDRNALPEKINGIGMRTYVVPQPEVDTEDYFIHQPITEYIAGENINIRCNIYSSNVPKNVNLYLKVNGLPWYKEYPMQKTGRHEYGFTADTSLSSQPAILDYIIGVDYGNRKVCFPSQTEGIMPDSWDFSPQQSYRSYITDGKDNLTVFDADKDGSRIRFTRIFKSLPFEHRFVPTGGQKLALELSCKNMIPSGEYMFPLDITASHYINDKIKARARAGIYPKNIIVTAKGTTSTTNRMLLSFNQSDCTSWSVPVELAEKMRPIVVPVSRLSRDVAPMLPQDWPGINSYWYPSLESHSDKIDWSKIENIFFSLRDRLFINSSEKSKGFQVESVVFEY